METSNNILESNPDSDVIVQNIYGLLEDLEAVLVCGMECGEVGAEILVYFCFYYYF